MTSRRLPHRPLLRRGPIAAAVVAAGLALAGCGTVGSSPAGSLSAASPTSTKGGEGRGGQLVIGMTAANIPALDTVLSAGQGYEGVRFVGNQLYDALTRYDLKKADGIPALVPSLATSWTPNANATTWTFKLRRGVTFTDGTPWNADAAVFNYRRFLDPKFRYTTPTIVGQAATYVGTVKSFRKVDDMTFELTTKVPNSHLPEDISTAFMASPTAVKKEGVAGFSAHPVGTGPFKFVSMASGQQLDLAPNADYWGGAPKLDSLVLKPMPEGTSRIAAMRSNSVNWIEYPSPDDITSLQKSGVQVLTNSYDHVWPIILDERSKPWSDVRVRRAANYAIDREAMAKSLLHGTAEPAYQVAPRANAAYEKQNDLYRYDPAKAKQLLQEAGYAKGFTTTVEYPTSGSGNMIPGPMNEAIQQDLAKVGIKVKLKPIEWAAMLTQYVGGGLPKGIDAINISLSFQQESFWTLSFGSTSPLNVGHYENPKVDALLGQVQTTVDPAARARLYAQIATHVTSDAPWLYVVNDRNPRALASTVHGFTEPKSWFVDLTSVWVK